MFGRNRASKGRIMTVIGPDVVIEGSVIGRRAIRVDGIVNGAVRTRDSVVIGSNGVVRGGIKASSVVNAGEVYGGIEAPQGRIEISDTGRVYGDLTAARVIIDEDAVFQGHCTLTGRSAMPASETILVPDDLEEQAEREIAKSRRGRSGRRRRGSEAAVPETDEAPAVTEDITYDREDTADETAYIREEDTGYGSYTDDSESYFAENTGDDGYSEEYGVYEEDPERDG